jgi:two-component system sensor histidine kinase DesK
MNTLSRQSLLPRALTMHPNSVGARLANGRWFPLLHLVWLFWMVSAPWFIGNGEPRIIVLTFLSLPVFLLLYFRAWYGDRSRIAWNTSAIAVLGLAMIPLNTSWSYIIYASVIIPYCAPPRRALLWLALLMVLFGLVALANDFSPLLCLSAATMCVALSVINLVGRSSRERDAELRLSHEEVRRLAAMAERERIGRDLHDLLGHTLSLIALKSELADKLFERDPASSRRELREVNRVARETLAQVRSAVTGCGAGIGQAAARIVGRIAADNGRRLRDSNRTRIRTGTLPA